MICAFGAKLPMQALNGPWTDDDVNFLHRFRLLTARWRTCDEDTAYQGMKDAIIQGRPEVVKLLSDPSIGVQLDHDFFRLAILKFGCNKSIVKIFVHAALRDEISIGCSDKKLRQWALKKEEEGDEKDTWRFD